MSQAVHLLNTPSNPKPDLRSDFPWYRRHIINIVYGMQRSMAFSPIWGDSLFEAHHRALSPGLMGDTVSRYADELESLITTQSELLQSVNLEEVDLIDWAYEIIVSPECLQTLLLRVIGIVLWKANTAHSTPPQAELSFPPPSPRPKRSLFSKRLTDHSRFCFSRHCHHT